MVLAFSFSAMINQTGFSSTSGLYLAKLDPLVVKWLTTSFFVLMVLDKTSANNQRNLSGMKNTLQRKGEISMARGKFTRTGFLR